MKDLYSFDIDEEGLDKSYKKMLQAYQNIYRRCGLPSLLVEADSGAIGGKDSHEFMVVTETGEDTVIYCPDCGYLANSEKAESVRDKLPAEEPLPLEEVATPGMASIEEVSGFLKVPKSRALKAVFYVADSELVFVVVRGDIEVNEVKLKNVLHCSGLRLATETELIAACIVAGSASPVGLSGIRIVADESITSGANFVAGANRADTHFRNVNYPRDFKADLVADIATAHAGDRCVRCGATLSSMSGIEVGHIFKLGTVFSEKLGAFYVDEEGASRPIVMGCYGIGIGRLMAAAVEKSHDEKGIIWPLPIAPYQVYLCPLYRENTQIEAAAENLYAELVNDGFEVLFDDRKQSPGVKFNDADLLGIPIRVTISPRTLDRGSVELKLRSSKETRLVPLAEIRTVLKGLVTEGLTA
jgi:prolyl-tRNA synthetase